MATPRTGVRAPQQQRSRESLERVLRAGEKLLAKNGYEGFTIAEVSRDASLSVGSVYGRFESKDALIYAIHARMLQRMTEEYARDSPDWRGVDIEDVVSRGIHRLADPMNGERALLRVFMLLAPIDRRIAKRASEVSRALSREFTAAVLEHRSEIKHPVPERAADVAFRMAYDVLARRIMYGPRFESEMTIPWDDLVDEVIRATIAYLYFERP
jgi:AcrR family transcriptional regulator